MNRALDIVIDSYDFLGYARGEWAVQRNYPRLKENLKNIFYF